MISSTATGPSAPPEGGWGCSAVTCVGKATARASHYRESSHITYSGLRQDEYVANPRTAFTWLPVARFTGVRFSNITGFAGVDVSGNRVPYAPEQTLTTTATYRHTRAVHLLVEAVHLGRQFGDDLNTVDPTPDGQRGLLPPNTL